MIPESLDDWDEPLVHALIANQTIEGQDLEFKSAFELARTTPQGEDRTQERQLNISRTVAAFANATRGRIVYGIAEKGKSAYRLRVEGIHEASIIPGGHAQLEQLIQSTVRPPVHGLKIKRIELSSKLTGRVVYVVDVPIAQPGIVHQAHDYVNYLRRGSACVPMLDFEVRNAYRRIHEPLVRMCVLTDYVNGTTLAVDQQITREQARSYLEPIRLDFSLENLSTTPVGEAWVEIWIGEHLLMGGEQWLARCSNENPVIVDKNLVSPGYRRAYWHRNRPTICRGLPVPAFERSSVMLHVPAIQEHREYYVWWIVRVPGMSDPQAAALKIDATAHALSLSEAIYEPQEGHPDARWLRSLES